MKYLSIFLFLFAGASKGQPLLADSTIKQLSLAETIFFLSQDSLKGRLTGSEGANIAATFIAARFKSSGLQPVARNEGYFDHFTANYYGKKIPAKNVVGALPGKFTNDTMVIFSAHYDHIGQRDDLPFNKDYSYQDDIFNGADDNATGVAALIELARYYKAQNNNRYLLLFVAFSGEEMGMLGSEYSLKKTNPGMIKAVINLEMLGRPDNKNCFIVSFRNTSLRNILNGQLKKYQGTGAEFFFKNDPYPDENLSSRSDHYPFARKIKNAFTIMGSSPADIHYHSVDDEYETIDFEFLLKATKNIALACEYFTR
ncbi:MAG: M20/M25/M40 family metallo-hydrolase [Ferruginibacter sp.]|nr:M20/M25/M40 family metallo-hydrolase [Ferruginibacter sp.]